ncbi:hypothetical protein H6P81_017806 [Aristolochia fimbriata]|uniref:Uncharacterized protein n=1 Tax=Aristolochia fimbriata TaxID=158543 RepID=A0AAV7DZP7_ARIFI|nr:hypothetical protein H6P81_017806 [Aristolochia fimbriata]
MITVLFHFSMELDSWVLEQAREELKTLEAQYPDRFDYLKLELRTFISHPGNLSPLLGSTRKEDDEEDEEKTVSGLSTSVCTQESSNRKRRSTVNRGTAPNPKKPKNGPSTRYKDAVDIAIEKAEACLRKIREIKQSFL